MPVRDLDIQPEPNRPTGGGDIPPPFYGVDLNRETAILVMVEALEWYAGLDLGVFAQYVGAEVARRAEEEFAFRAEQALGIWRSGGYDHA